MLNKVAYALVIIGGLNWLLVGVGGADWNVVSYLGEAIARVVYVLVGLSAIYLIAMPKKKMSSGSSMSM